MKKVKKAVFIPILTVILMGCGKVGYIVTITTVKMNSCYVQEIEEELLRRRFTLSWMRTKEKAANEYIETHKFFEKKLSDKPYHCVIAYLNYLKDSKGNIVYKLRIDIHNIYQRLTVREIKDEMDSNSLWIYQLLMSKVPTKIGRKEIDPYYLFRI